MKPVNQVDIEKVLEALTMLEVEYELIGPLRKIKKVCSLLAREPYGLYYFTGDKYIEGLVDSVVICKDPILVDLSKNSAIIVSRDPQVVFYTLCEFLFVKSVDQIIHHTAIIHSDAKIESEVVIGPYCIVGRCSIGKGTVLSSHVVVEDDCEIGENVTVESHSCIGATGVMWTWDESGNKIRLPQLGSVVIENDVFIGCDVAVVRGALNEATTIKQGCMIAPGSKIGHSVIMERDCHLANNVSIAGNARIGARCFLGSGSSVRPHARLAEDIIVGAGAVVAKDFDKAGITIAGVPAVEIPVKKDRIGVPRRSTHGTKPIIK